MRLHSLLHPLLRLGVVGCCALPAMLTAPALGQSPATQLAERPAAAGRVVRLFDFEERETNPGEVPRYWYRAQDNPEAGFVRDGYPAWNKPELTYRSAGGTARRGDGAVRLPTQGGSTVLVLGTGVLPIFQNADYLASAYVKTRGLKHARAGFICRLLDATGEALPGHERVSELVTSEEGWTEVRVELPTDVSSAAYMQVELLLLQPKQVAEFSPQGLPAGQFEVWKEDFEGEAIFDDVSIVQLPRIELTSSAPGNIAVGKAPGLSVVVRDLTGENLRVEAQVMDMSGRVVDVTSRDQFSGLVQLNWTPNLPEFGWYRATVTLTEKLSGIAVGGQAIDIVWLDATGTAQGRRSREERRPTSPDAARFGLHIRSLSEGLATDLGEATRRLGTGAIALPAWGKGTSAAHAQLLAASIGELLGNWQEVTLALSTMPRQLASEARVEQTDVWGLLRTDASIWMPWCEPVFEKYGQRVSRWQVGDTTEDRAFWMDDGWKSYATARTAIGTHVPGPVVSIPTDLRYAWDASRLSSLPAPTRLLARVDPSQTPESVRSGVSLISQRVKGAHKTLSLGLVFSPDRESGVSLREGVSELVKKCVEGWRLANEADLSLWLDDPWREGFGRRMTKSPTPEAAAFANLARRLRDRRVVVGLSSEPGVICYLLAPINGSETRGGAIVAWSESTHPRAQRITLPLGSGVVRRYDVFGNSSELSPTLVNGRAKVYDVSLSTEPVFLEGVDVHLAAFLAGVKIEPAFLDLAGEQQDRTIVITNPWTVNLTGSLTVLEPGGYARGGRDRSWRISPRSTPFTLGPGQTERIPLTVWFSGTEEAGTKNFVFGIEVTAEEKYGVVEVTRPVEMGLEDFRLDVSPSSITGSEGGVEASIINTSSRPLTLELTCLAPGHPRAKATVVQLKPGKQAIRRFLIADIEGKLRGEKVLVTAFEPETGIRLHKSLVMP